jgi:hypothetical protein
MNKLLIFSDISGDFSSFYEISKRYPYHIKISNGDINDRKHQTKQLLDYFINKKRTLAIYGNHEDIMVDFYLNTKRYTKTCWFINGGIPTVLSFIKGKKNKKDFQRIANDFIEKPTDQKHEVLLKKVRAYIPIKYINFLLNLPWFIETEDLFISHAPIPPKVTIDQFKKDCLNKNYEVLWNRKVSLKSREKYCIFGHNSSEEIIEYNNSVNLDSSSGEKLSAYDNNEDEFIVLNIF